MLFKYLVIYIVSFIGLFASLFFLLTLIEGRKRIENPVPKRFPFVSVIIPAYNEEKNIAQTIESVQALVYPGRLDILIIDDGSRDKTFKVASKIAENDPRIKVFRQENKGKASAINFGMSKTKAEFIATLDADSFVDQDSLMKMIGYFEDRKVAAVTPSLKVYQPKTIVQKVQKVEYLWGIFLRKVFAFMNALHVTPGPFSIFRKSFFEKHGGFDEKNPTEDTEIALRIQSHHYKIENSIDAEVYTVSPPTFKQLLIQRIRWYYGLMKNLRLYPHLFNPRYGYVALFSLPAAIISVIMIIYIILYFTYLWIAAFLQTLADWNAVGFDFLTMMHGFKWEYLYYELTSPLTVLLLTLTAFNILFLVYAEFKSKEKDKIDVAYIYYFCFYTYFYAIWWMAAIFYWLFGRIKWAEISYD